MTARRRDQPVPLKVPGQVKEEIENHLQEWDSLFLGRDEEI